jgi:hypothetical protein
MFSATLLLFICNWNKERRKPDHSSFFFTVFFFYFFLYKIGKKKFLWPLFSSCTATRNKLGHNFVPAFVLHLFSHVVKKSFCSLWE